MKGVRRTKSYTTKAKAWAKKIEIEIEEKVLG